MLQNSGNILWNDFSLPYTMKTQPKKLNSFRRKVGKELEKRYQKAEGLLRQVHP